MAQTSEDRLPCGCVLYTDPDDHDDRGCLEHCLRHERDCDDRGRTDDQYAALTGFSGRAVSARSPTFERHGPAPMRKRRLRGTRHPR